MMGPICTSIEEKNGNSLDPCFIGEIKKKKSGMGGRDREIRTMDVWMVGVDKDHSWRDGAYHHLIRLDGWWGNAISQQTNT